MKKLVSMIIAFVGVLFLLPIASNAAGAISANEQEILDALNQGVTIDNGQTFYFSATDIQQAENELKANDYDKKTTDTVVANINAARQLVIDNSKGLSATSLNDLLKQLPKHVQDQIRDYILASAKALGLSIDQNGIIVDNSGKKVFVPTTSNNPVVKTTGVASSTGIMTVIALVAITAVLGTAVTRKGQLS
ncbi:hypothetical protein [Vagococcus jeotgali]|uniref:hypothetical protein n=1 Tax=Vagococcus jeotgali TaxID=3109030 RepID=UPI002DDB719D|nr:hypothetical protein [Vagococcus sp. B2T-5]